MLLSNYKPRPALAASSTPVEKPRFTAIDAHNHLFGDLAEKPARHLLDLLDQAGVWGFVDLDGMRGEETLYQHLDKLKSADPQRFRVFGGVDWKKWPELGDGFVEWAVERMHEQARRGADGFKVWKNFGLRVRDHHYRLVEVDDPRLDPLWQTAGALNKPLTFHVADPVAFFSPLDAYNERWEELQVHPDWHFPSPPFPPFRRIVDGLANLVDRHPNTTIIGAHAGCYAENLDWIGSLFERCPNFYIDISARLAELGRQPYTARRFFMKYADRILFGLDAQVDPAAYRLYYRFLETEDEYFSYDTGEIPGQGRWMIYGIHLPDEVLEKVYAGNARRIIFNRA